MKKTIATISLAMVMGCGLALVHANDSMSSTTSNTTTTTGDTGGVQQPGTAGTSDTTTDHMAAPDTDKSATDTYSQSTTTKTSKAKSCTDDTGKVLYKGQKGFKDCMKNREQMGGTAEQSKTEIQKHSETSNPSDMNSAPSHDTGNMNNQ